MYRCKTCKSENVEGRYWCNHNTFKISDVTDDSEVNWCEECAEYCEIYDDELDEDENEQYGFYIHIGSTGIIN